MTRGRDYKQSRQYNNCTAIAKHSTVPLKNEINKYYFTIYFKFHLLFSVTKIRLEIVFFVCVRRRKAHKCYEVKNVRHFRRIAARAYGLALDTWLHFEFRLQVIFPLTATLNLRKWPKCPDVTFKVISLTYQKYAFIIIINIIINEIAIQRWENIQKMLSKMLLGK